MEKTPKRKRNRLNKYDYSNNGAYFITICTKEMKCILSQIVGATSGRPPKVHLLEYGKIAANELKRINEIYDNVTVDGFIVMPNHIHLLLTIDDRRHSKDFCSNRSESFGRPHVAPTVKLEYGRPQVAPTVNLECRRPQVAPTVSQIIQQFKGAVTKQSGQPVWQKGFYDHIIRSEEDYNLHMQYIDENPKKWLMGNDEYYS